jgi:hypothetical protein
VREALGKLTKRATQKSDAQVSKEQWLVSFLPV